MISTWILLGIACAFVALGCWMAHFGMRNWNRGIERHIRTCKRLQAERKRLIENPPKP